MSNHDSKGRFVKGNSAAKGKEDPRIKEIRLSTKLHIAECVESLSRPYSTLNKELRESGTRLEYLTAHAITNGNTKFIQWLVEMIVGKPVQDSNVTAIEVPREIAYPEIE